jgi:hypothetical protein
VAGAPPGTALLDRGPGGRARHLLVRHREPATAGALAVVVAGALVLFGPPGVDLAAHAYLTSLFSRHGLVVWDNSWYAGRYPFLTYSLLYYPLASLVGVQVLGVVSVGVAALAFSGLCRLAWGSRARPAILLFAVVWGGVVLSAAYPLVLGVAFALLALWALEAGRADRAGSAPVAGAGRQQTSGHSDAVAALRRWWRLWFSGAAILTFAASPLALVLLVLAVVAIALGDPRERRALVGPGVVLVALVVVQLVLMRLFPDHGRYPFWWLDLVQLEVFCALGIVLAWRVRAARVLRVLLGLYGLASLAAFLVPSDLGANMTVIRYLAIPAVALLCGLRSFRPAWLCWPALALAAWWNLSPLVAAFAADGAGPESQASYWSPTVAWLEAHLAPGYRVEVVDTVGHWGAYFLPAHGIPIARGWFRQDDFPTNALLYEQGPLRPSQYLAWLRSLGVAYVVLPDAPLDFSSQAEASLLSSGRSALSVVDRSAHQTLYAVPHPTPIVTGPGPVRVLHDGRESLTVAAGAAGTYRVAVHWSPYWTASSGCVAPSSSGMTELSVGRPEVVTIKLEVTVGRLWSTFLGAAPPACPAPRAP